MACLDLVLDHDLSLFAVYLIPTLYSAWFLGMRWGLVACAATNRSQSEQPREIGFNEDWMTQSAGSGDSQTPGTSGGGRGRRGSSGGGGRAAGAPVTASRESYDEARRLQVLTGEVRNPAVRLIIVDTPAAVTITNEPGQSRVLHPGGKEESVPIQGVPMTVTTERNEDRLVVRYHVGKDRGIRYTYSRAAGTPQLLVEAELLGRGGGDKARLVYDPGADTQASAAAASAPGATASSRPAAETFDARPGAELRGLKSLGVLVEDLGSQAIACGLDRDAIETALSKRLSDGGFSVRRNSDDDTYLYVNVQTASVAGGMCLSRYDAFLYTHATANLSYHDQPVLVQVSLMHRGGIGTSAPSAHAAAVTRGLENYVDLFVTQIREANRQDDTPHADAAACGRYLKL